jgi:hypothetical protein
MLHMVRIMGRLRRDADPLRCFDMLLVTRSRTRQASAARKIWGGSTNEYGTVMIWLKTTDGDQHSKDERAWGSLNQLGGSSIITLSCSEATRLERFAHASCLSRKTKKKH